MSLDFLEKSYNLGAGEIDPFGVCRPSAIHGFLQDAATLHAEELGVAREGLIERHGVFWLLVRIGYTLSRPALYGQTLTVRTWHRGVEGALFYRDFDLLADGDPIGEGVSAWAVVDWTTHSLRRMVSLSFITELGQSAQPAKKPLPRLTAPPSLTPAGLREIRYSDLDVNRHLNNVRVSDIVCDALALTAHERAFVSSVQISYRAQSVVGETLRLSRGELPDGRSYVRAEDKDGAVRFEAAVRVE